MTDISPSITSKVFHSLEHGDVVSPSHTELSEVSSGCMQPFIDACVHTHVSTVNHTTSVESLWKDCFAVLHITIVTAIPAITLTSCFL